MNAAQVALAVALAHYVGVALFLCGAGLLVRGIIRSRTASARADQCPHCGYSLSGLAGAPCPECGWHNTSGESLARAGRRVGLNRADKDLTWSVVLLIAGTILSAL